MQGIELGATRLSVDQTLYVPAYNDKARMHAETSVECSCTYVWLTHLYI